MAQIYLYSTVWLFREIRTSVYTAHLTWILARVFVYVPPFISQILDSIYWTVLIFILIYFELRDTENQQFRGERVARTPESLKIRSNGNY